MMAMRWQQLKTVTDEVNAIHELHPQLHLKTLDLGNQVVQVLQETTEMGTSFFNFMQTGSGYIAYVVIAIICLVWFYSEGPRLARSILALSPFQRKNAKTS